jgi:serine phosphatase RsbU (regulator of sigma subunit)
MTKPEEKKLLLLVDDTPANIQVANSILKEDYKIRVATSGEKALELVNAKPVPDLILLDVMMPEMDGYEVCSRLKARKETRDIPVIFLTGQTDADDETKGFHVGAVDYIHKPFSPSVVKARVHTHIVLREAHRQLAQQLRHINNELEMARRIQLAILPSEIPKTKGLEIAVRYLPMTSVAGDFYDFIAVDDEHVGILVADVTGHGLAAALIGSMLQVSLAAQSAHASDPGRVLAGLNHALCGKFQQHFVTAAYVFVDMEKSLISYAGAGHPPLLTWQRSTGRAVEFMENGLLLGHFSDEVYSTVCFPVESGDRCVLYTDAILETMNPSEEQFGIDRFLRFMESNHELSAHCFADSLLSELSRWSEHSQGQGQADDITLLTIDFRRC